MDKTVENHAGAFVSVDKVDSTVVKPQAHPHRSLVSRALSFLGKGREYCAELGLISGLRWYFSKVLARLRLPGMGRIRIKPPAVAHPLTVRMFPSSDDFIFDHIFVRHEYDPVCSRLGDVKSILDLGANVGYSSAFFASRYPAARILAVEPDPNNYHLCRQNLEPYGDRAKTVLGAVWAKRSKLALSRGTSCDKREWSSQVVEARNGTDATVEAWDMTELLDMAEQKEADLVKVDIEGSEAEVFAANAAEWLPRVRNICIELHDDRCRQIFLMALNGFDYELVEFGELTLCRNLRRAA